MNQTNMGGEIELIWTTGNAADKVWQHHAAGISALIKETNYLDAGALVRNAVRELEPKALLAMRERLPRCKASKFSKLKTIGETTWLYAHGVEQRLPRTLTVLYALAGLGKELGKQAGKGLIERLGDKVCSESARKLGEELAEEAVRKAIGDGTISPAMEERAFYEWRREVLGEDLDEKQPDPPRKPRLVNLFIAASDEERAEVEALIDRRRAGERGPIVAEEVLASVH